MLASGLVSCASHAKRTRHKEGKGVGVGVDGCCEVGVWDVPEVRLMLWIDLLSPENVHTTGSEGYPTSPNNTDTDCTARITDLKPPYWVRKKQSATLTGVSG